MSLQSRDAAARSATGPGDPLPLAPRLLVTGFRPGPGGIGRDMINLINGCVHAGIDVHVLLEPADNPDEVELAPAARVDQLALNRAEAIATLASYIMQIRPDAILANSDQSGAWVIAAAAGLRPRPRVVIRVGTHVPAKLRAKRVFSRWRRRRRLVAAYRAADLLIGVSDGACDGLRELLGDDAPPIRRIYSPIDIQRIAALAAERPTHPWFTDRTGPLLVSVGRLSRIKDQMTMVRALALLPSDCRLVIFGEGKQRGALEGLAQRLGVAARVALPGHSPNPFAHVARADLFVLSSRFEGFGNALLEALIVGTPVVSTDCPTGPREILGGGLYGRLVPIGDPGAMAQAITDTLQSPPPAALLTEAVARLELGQAIPHYLDAMGLAAERGSV
jgi:glycosyltransferase involved in cell wall biosynthesis